MLNFSFPYILNTTPFRLIRQNILYGGALIFFLFLGFAFIPKQITQYNDLRAQESVLNEEIKKQEARLQLINSINVADINRLLILLNTLYPQKEDPFSINPAINNLEIVTGMDFYKTSSPFASTGQIVITINASATHEQLLSLFSHYIYKSARILSMKDIVIRSAKSGNSMWDTMFAVEFHSGTAVAGKGEIKSINQKGIAFAQEAQKFFLSKDPSYTKITIEEKDIPLNYPVKDNPFVD